jgi:hypothetical protein
MTRHAMTLIALLVICRCSLAELPATMPAEPGKPFVHQSSGFVFPDHIADAARVAVTRYDEAGENISAGYNQRDIRLVITVYVYPRVEELKPHMQRVQRDILLGHPQAKLIEQAERELKQGGENGAAEKSYTLQYAKYNFPPDDRVPIELMSQAYLTTVGERFIKWRCTYPADHAKEAEEKIASFMHDLTLPAEK